MTKVQNQETRKRNKLRYAEYYDQQPLQDRLYRLSREGKTFDKLMPLIMSQSNIVLAYRNIKRNKGSMTAGVDRKTIADVEAYSIEEVATILRKRIARYQPKAVKRVEIPKPNGSTRPLGIPSIWDRLIQQCILQVLEPICEARFSDNSYGFRPLRSTEHAIAHVMRLINQSKLRYVVEVDIKGFFDNVDHVKLMNQLWAMGIRDKMLLKVIKKILKAPIRMPDGELVYPVKGTPQGGILSPLLANVVLNELDQWVDSQWQENPVTSRYSQGMHSNGTPIKSPGYQAMRKTNLKEMFIVRYADDVRILCRTRSQANRTMMAVKLFLNDRLRLQVSGEKTRVVNVKRKSSEFLGISMKATAKAGKFVVRSHMGEKAIQRTKQKLKEQIKAIQHPKNDREQINAIARYNSMVRGVHNYFQMATDGSIDFHEVGREVNTTMINRLRRENLKRNGSMSKKSRDYKRYGKSKQLRFFRDYPILPIAYAQSKNPMCKKVKLNAYTPEGRREIHDELRIANKHLMNSMSKNPVAGQSIEYNDNRVSLFAGQYGKCAITGIEFLSTDEIHCHHKKPKSMGGTDRYQNLMLVLEDVHRLIHAKTEDLINQLLDILKLTKEQIKKINQLRTMAGCEPL